MRSRSSNAVPLFQTGASSRSIPRRLTGRLIFLEKFIVRFLLPTNRLGRGRSSNRPCNHRITLSVSFLSMLPSLPQRNARRHETNRSFLLVLKGYHRSERARLL